jgi:predicted negative regulator of RcsB-dependent stress response
MFAWLRRSKPKRKGLLAAFLMLVALFLIGGYYSWDHFVVLAKTFPQETPWGRIGVVATLLGLLAALLGLWWVFRPPPRPPTPIPEQDKKDIAKETIAGLEKQLLLLHVSAATQVRQAERIEIAITDVQNAIGGLETRKDADSRRVIKLLGARNIQGAKNELRRIFRTRERQGLAVAQDARWLAAFTRGDDPWGAAALFSKAAELDGSARNWIDLGDVSLVSGGLAQSHRKQALVEAACAFEEARTRAQGVADATKAARARLNSVLNMLGYSAAELPDSIKSQVTGQPPQRALQLAANYLDLQEDERIKAAANRLRVESDTEDAKRALESILTATMGEGGEGYKGAWEVFQHLATLYRHDAERNAGDSKRWIDLGDVYERAARLSGERGDRDFMYARNASEEAYKKGPFEGAAKWGETGPLSQSASDSINQYGASLASRLGDLFDEIGDALDAKHELQAALQFYEKSRNVRHVLVSQDPASHRDLALIEEKIGDALVREIRISDLLRARRELGIAKVVAHRHDPDERLSFNLWRDVAVLDEEKLKDLGQANGLRAALKAYRASLSAVDSSRPRPQEEVAELHRKIGDVLFAQRDLDGAKTCYEKALNRIRLGDLLLAYGEREKAEKAAADCYKDADTALLVEKLADAHWAANDDRGARTHYDEALKHLTSHDLARLRAKLGDAWVADDAVKAYEAYSESRTIRKKLADAEPGNPDLRINLARSHGRLGDFLYGIWKQSLEPQKRTKIPAPLADKVPKEALTEWNAALLIYEELVGTDPRASDALLLVEPLWRVGELNVNNGFAELEKASAYLLLAKQLKPYQQDWRNQINRAIERIPAEKRISNL